MSFLLTSLCVILRALGEDFYVNHVLCVSIINFSVNVVSTPDWSCDIFFLCYRPSATKCLRKILPFSIHLIYAWNCSWICSLSLRERHFIIPSNGWISNTWPFTKQLNYHIVFSLFLCVANIQPKEHTLTFAPTMQQSSKSSSIQTKSLVSPTFLVSFQMQVAWHGGQAFSKEETIIDREIDIVGPSVSTLVHWLLFWDFWLLHPKTLRIFGARWMSI